LDKSPQVVAFKTSSYRITVKLLFKSSQVVLQLSYIVPVN